MSEIKEIEESSKESRELEPQKNISPSSVNTYFKCPRSYFYNYIAKLKTKPSIHLVKGTIVHSVLEDFFRGYKNDMEQHMLTLFSKRWEKSEQSIKDLEISDEEIAAAKQDCLNIINEYYVSIERQMKSLIQAGKAENLQHAYYLIKPKFREKKVSNEDLHCLGFIDRISEGYDGALTLGDYKTSSKYGIGLPMDYKRQLAIYALLYSLQEKTTPDFVAVIFLRYGMEYILEVTPSLLKYATGVIEETYAKTRSTSIEEYPLKEGALCKWCDFRHICDGTEDWEKKLRMQKLKEIATKEKKDKEKAEKKKAKEKI